MLVFGSTIVGILPLGFNSTNQSTLVPLLPISRVVTSYGILRSSRKMETLYPFGVAALYNWIDSEVSNFVPKRSDI